MKITGFIWLEDIIDKLNQKHSVEVDEVRELFQTNLGIDLLKKGIEKKKMFMRH